MTFSINNQPSGHYPFENREVWRLIGKVDVIAGYPLAREQRAGFLRFHAFITGSPPPKYITAWRSAKATEKWYLKHVDGVLGHVQSAVACAYYHCDNLRLIENRIRDLVAQTDLDGILGNSGIGVSNTIRFDAEYQAFVLAVRRSLDYLTRALSAYFKSDNHSFRTMAKFLAKAKPTSVASAIVDAQTKHIKNMRYVLSDGENKSIRDLLSHYEYISAGTLNLNRNGFVIVGGPEKLDMGQKWDGGFAEIIQRRSLDLQSCVSDILDAFVAAAKDENDR